MPHKNRSAACLLKKALSLTAAFVLFAGCGYYKKDDDGIPARDELPSVTDYVSQARCFRDYEAEETMQSAEETSSSRITSASSGSQTVSEGEALSSQTETLIPESQTETAALLTEETEAVSEADTSVTETEASSDSVTEAPAETAPSSQATTELETECSVPAAQSPAAAPSNAYDSEFFSSDLFVGDSISTGYSLYGFLNDKNVFAKVGLNPSTVLTKSVVTCYGEIGICSMLEYTMPQRVYIMLGSNGIQWLSVGNMLQSTDTLVGLIKECCPDSEVVIISVPPVTPKYDNTVADVDVMAKINEYNTSLCAYCSANKMLFVDVASVLKDETGYFDTTYAESDGMHFKSPAYKIVLSKIQNDVEGFEAMMQASADEAAAAEKIAAQTVTEVSAEETAETAAPKASETEIKTSVSAESETFMTLPETTREKTNGTKSKKNKLSENA